MKISIPGKSDQGFYLGPRFGEDLRASFDLKMVLSMKQQGRRSCFRPMKTIVGPVVRFSKTTPKAPPFGFWPTLLWFSVDNLTLKLVI